MIEQAAAERESLNKYVEENNVETLVSDVLLKLLTARPANPRQFLLKHLEAEIREESKELSESDLHKLFISTRKITSEIVPLETIKIILDETVSLLKCDMVALYIYEKRMCQHRLQCTCMEQPVMVPAADGIAGVVFHNQKPLIIDNAYADRRFNKHLDDLMGYKSQSICAVPIFDFDGAMLGVLQATNKRKEEEAETPTSYVSPISYQQEANLNPKWTKFGTNDERIMNHLVQHVGIALRNAEVYREAINTSERATGLLNTIQSLCQDLGTQSLLLTITMHANKIVSAQRSTVFLVDEPHQQLWSVSTDTGVEIRIPKTAGIAGLCCTTAEVINIPDAYADSRFNQAMDKKTGFRTQSILAIPMFEDDLNSPASTKEAQRRASEARKSLGMNKGEKVPNKVIGVIQMINKTSFDGNVEVFDETDVEVMELFAKFVGPKLAQSSMLTQQQKAAPSVSEGDLALGKKPPVAEDLVPASHRLSKMNLEMSINEADEEEAED
eukprot:gnl/TRDRNA2_/TRDRNA2_190490_c0_seq1.p1 gnl/TRDRNA2_/TRDRNA2_190490_c0~~gnl/TRDRNA2_/TRDRNA2_190490_c0_seq1.p1  ORF type:complete len:499 (+),score=129.02 gnl/TRDRNA2_/TRDRNA2_190490_c0_seq1:94-1590(+)